MSFERIRMKRVIGSVILMTLGTMHAAAGTKQTAELSRSSGSAMSPIPTPAAEVVASSGPVEMIFRVRDTKLKPGEPLWVQIGLKNIGKETYPFYTGLMNNFQESADHAHENRFGIYFETDPPSTPENIEELRKKAAKYDFKLPAGLDIPWVKLAPPMCFDDFFPPDGEEVPSGRRVKPGETVWSTPWFFSCVNRKESGCVRCPPSPYTQLWQMVLRPGKHRIRVVHKSPYANEKTQERLKPYGVKPSLADVVFHTPWIVIEVTP